MVPRARLAAPLSVSPPLRASRQLSQGESQVYARGWRLSCGKANLKRPLLLYSYSKRSRFPLVPPEGGMSRSDRGDTLKGWRAGLDINNAGASLYSRPPQRDPIFRDAKVLLFWCDQQQKELLVRYFPFVVTGKGWCQTGRRLLNPPASYIKYSMVPCTCYKYVLIRPSEKR